MAQSYKLKSGSFEITLAQTGKDKGTVSVREGRKRPRLTKLYGIRAKSSGIVCKADLGFFDPVIELMLEPTGVRIDAPGQSHDKRYPASAADISGLRQFLVACAFPRS